VVLNLVSNAVKFTAQGAIRIGADVVRRAGDQVTVHFFVADTGAGIPEAKRKLIFQAFEQADHSVTRRYGGAGLGLAICSRLVRMLDGEIWVDSRLGVGSTFHFTVQLEADRTPTTPRLPAWAPAEGTPGQSPTTVPPDRALRVLVVEDEDVSREVAVRILNRRGHLVTAAARGRQAWAIWESDPDGFDVLVTDISMPEMGGLELTRAIRQHESGGQRRLPIIAMTANALKGDAERCLAEGMDGYVAKPIRRDEFLRSIEESRRDAAASASAAADGASRPPVCDVPQLLAAYDHNLGFVAQLVQVFFQVYQQELPQLRAAAANQDAEDAGRRAHRLKGSVGNLRGASLQAVAERMEQQARAGNLDALPGLLAELEHEFCLLKPVLQNAARSGDSA
jgi:CheY-like chemotaxis protein